MSQIIKTSKLSPREIMPSGSRYLKQQVIYYGEKGILTFDTYNRQNYRVTGKEQITLITKGTEYRPDLVSYDAYGFTDNWWRILEANKIKDIWEFKAGRTIILPDKVL